MLLNTDFRKGGSRVGVFGVIEANQRSSFPVGVYLFGASEKLTTHVTLDLCSYKSGLSHPIYKNINRV
jgi:hypothetical protein